MLVTYFNVVFVCLFKLPFSPLLRVTELARQSESAKLLEDKVKRAEAEAREMQQAKQMALAERERLNAMVLKEKAESEAYRLKMNAAEENAKLAKRSADVAQKASKEAMLQQVQ